MAFGRSRSFCPDAAHAGCSMLAVASNGLKFVCSPRVKYFPAQCAGAPDTDMSHAEHSNLPRA